MRKSIFVFCLMLLVITIGSSQKGLSMSKKKIIHLIENCPSSPNCVSSLTKSTSHYLPPWELKISVKEAKKKVEGIVLQLPRTELVESGKDYLHFTFTSSLLRFTDDVWFYFDEKAKKIHYRSSSRIGYSDFGVNRKRMIELQLLFSESS